MDDQLSTQTNYDEYGIRHFSYHLYEAGMSDDLYHLVVTKEWYRCSLDFASSGQLYREDIRRAFLAAADQIESMAHTGNLSAVGNYLVRPAVLAWISASLVQAMKQVPLSVLDAMIRLGDTDQVVQRVEAIPDPINRAKLLVNIGQTIFELGGHLEANSLWNQARELLLSSPADFFNEKYEALGQLVCARARAGHSEEALSLADNFQAEVEGKEWGAVSTPHIALASAWGAMGKIERTLAAARAITNKEDQITALCGAAGNMLPIDRHQAMDILDKALGLVPGIKHRKVLFKLAEILAESGRLTDAWRVAGKNVGTGQRSRILMAAAMGALQSDKLVTGRQWLKEAFRTALTVESEEERLMLLIELARIGHPIVNENIADRLRLLINHLWKKSGTGLVSLQPSSDGKPTARRAIKSFSGGPGGRFFKKAPLAAGGNNKIDATPDWEKRGKIALGLLALGDTPGAKEAVSVSLDWQLPKDDWEENDALIELAGVLGQLGDIHGLDWVFSRAKQRQMPRQQAELAYHAAKAFTETGALAHAKEAEQLMQAAALRAPSGRGILAVWREENMDSPTLQATARELLDQALNQLEGSGNLTDDLVQIALTLAREKKFPLASWAIQQLLEALKHENDPNTLARVIGLTAEAAVIVNNYELLHSLKAIAKTIDSEWLQAEALCWIAGWQAVIGRYKEARQTYFEVISHDHELWKPVNPVDIETALKTGDMDWVVEIASDIGWPTAEAAAIFAALATALERPGPCWIEGALHAIDNIMEGYNSVRTSCHHMIVRKIAVEPDKLEAALKYWLNALEHSRKRDSGETWAVISAALPFFYKQFGRSFVGSLWLELAQAHRLLSEHT
jgi:tetratricopeptide (TPR) repeat protein